MNWMRWGRGAALGLLTAALGGCESGQPRATAMPMAISKPTEGSQVCAVETTKVKNLTTDGRVYIGGAVQPGGMADLRAQGIGTVIDVREDSEIAPGYQDQVQSARIRYVHVPIGGKQVDFAKVNEAIAALDEASSGMVLVHCSSGNRAGAVYGMFLHEKRGVDRQRAFDEAVQAGLRRPALRAKIAERLGARDMTPVATEPAD